MAWSTDFFIEQRPELSTPLALKEKTMKNITVLLLCALSIALLSGCENPFTRHKNMSKSAEAAMITVKMTNGAQMYFASEQMYTGPEGQEPWHTKEDAAGGELGTPVNASAYVFPGGTNFTMTTHDTIPEGGEMAKVTLDTKDPRVAKVLERLMLDFGTESYFRYTYSTGPGKGEKATATIKAEADFNTSSPEAHTITYELSYDKAADEVIVSPAKKENELQ